MTVKVASSYKVELRSTTRMYDMIQYSTASLNIACAGSDEARTGGQYGGEGKDALHGRGVTFPIIEAS